MKTTIRSGLLAGSLIALGAQADGLGQANRITRIAADNGTSSPVA